MPYAVVTVETDSRDRVDVALPLDVPSNALAISVMQGLGKDVGEGDSFAFVLRGEQGETRIPANASLGDAGVLDGQYLQIKREARGTRAEAPRSTAYLRTEAGETIALEGVSATLGRRDVKKGVLVEVDLSGYDPNKVVSRRHATIERDGMKYYLTDLGSTNGTKLNGKHLIARQRMPLQDGDSIEFGRDGVKATFKLNP